MHNTGQKPGAGIYRCVRCGTIIKITKPDEVLRSCPKCHYTQFYKVQ
jgi:DNA-directed RNA polymerase subunit RPC12/RpoP